VTQCAREEEELKQGKRDSGSRHFSDELWADFARHIGTEEVRAELQAHLDAGCEGCRMIANRFLAVARMAFNERLLAVPPELVERAKKIATRVQSSGWIENLTVIIGHLTDTRPLDWQPAGVRSGPGSAGQEGARLTFRAADYSVHLKVEPLLGGEEAEIIGEIANEGGQEGPMEGIPVQMVLRGRIFSESVTNRFGEFLIGSPIRNNVTLRLALKDRGQRIDLPLGSLLNAGTLGDRG
jgi:hypothetical protein